MAFARLLRVFLGSWLLAAPLGGRAQAAPPPSAALLAAHRTVAILPFEATVQVLRMHDLVYPGTATKAVLNQRAGQEGPPPDAAQLRQQLEAAYQLQELTMQQLLARPPKRGYRVQWQPVAETNRRLLAAGINYTDLARQPLARLRQVLGVDALLTGQVLLYQPIPKSLGLALRALNHEALLNRSSSVPPSQTEASLALYDCGSGRLVWQFDYGRAGANALPPTRLAPRLVKAALPTLPYCLN